MDTEEKEIYAGRVRELKHLESDLYQADRRIRQIMMESEMISGGDRELLPLLQQLREAAAGISSGREELFAILGEQYREQI